MTGRDLADMDQPLNPVAQFDKNAKAGQPRNFAHHHLPGTEPNELSTMTANGAPVSQGALIAHGPAAIVASSAHVSDEPRTGDVPSYS